MIPIMVIILKPDSQNSNSPKKSNSTAVDNYNRNKKDGNEDAWVDLISRNPVLNDKSGCRQLIGCDDDVFDPQTVM